MTIIAAVAVVLIIVAVSVPSLFKSRKTAMLQNTAIVPDQGLDRHMLSICIDPADGTPDLFGDAWESLVDSLSAATMALTPIDELGGFRVVLQSDNLIWTLHCHLASPPAGLAGTGRVAIGLVFDYATFSPRGAATIGHARQAGLILELVRAELIAAGAELDDELADRVSVDPDGCPDTPEG